MEKKQPYYHDYLQLEKILQAQVPESAQAPGGVAHDEMLFIIIHQAYELWFKQVLYELDSVLGIMRKPSLNDNSPDLQTIVHRLNRVQTILKVLVQQIDIMETMTPMDFLEFRDELRPASGFQSWQFKVLEAKLGLRFAEREGREYYLSQLRPREIETIRAAEEEASVLVLLNGWLERMPFINEAFRAEQLTKDSSEIIDGDFWQQYENVYLQSLAAGEEKNALAFKMVFHDEPAIAGRQLSPRACRSALFILLYRGYPMLELPFQLLQALLGIDNELGQWRSRHVNMVRRMIGTRVGTGGSTGAGYLQAAMDKHFIFRELAQLNSFLINRRLLPQLPETLTRQLGYHFSPKS